MGHLLDEGKLALYLDLAAESDLVVVDGDADRGRVVRHAEAELVDVGDDVVADVLVLAQEHGQRVLAADDPDQLAVVVVDDDGEALDVVLAEQAGGVHHGGCCLDGDRRRRRGARRRRVRPQRTRLPQLGADTREALARLLPAQASLANPIDTTAGVDADTFGACLEVLLAADEVDAVLVAGVPTALADPVTAVAPIARAR
nr:hypothetical protein [Actinophytocola sp.]